MLRDKYDNEITTSSGAARDLYIEAVDRLLGAAPFMVEGFAAVVAADPDFALGHSGLARALQIIGNIPDARAAMAAARAVAPRQSEREAAHLHAMSLLIDGKGVEAYRAIRAHVAVHPRDAMLAQTCTSVFGLIGFSGQPGREAELLAYTSELLPHYEGDWWCMGQHAFSLCETGQVDRADALIDQSLAINPRNAHGAHVRSHVYYEAGEPKAGMSYLQGWLADYDRQGIMHGHLSWHVALWALEMGDTEQMWQRIDADAAPGGSLGPPINVLTDTASFLYRAALAGHDVPAERWQGLSDYAKRMFPNTGLGFVDVHAALAHAMAGDEDAVEAIIASAVGPSADVVRDLAETYRAIARQDWDAANRYLTVAMTDHARIGGSRAQRDLLQFTLLDILVKQGRGQEARHLLALHRPVQANIQSVAGL